MRFDFSAFDDKLETLEERFQEYCFIDLRHALERHPDLFPRRRSGASSPPSAIDGKLASCSNTPASTASRSTCSSTSTTTSRTRCWPHRGREAYESFTHGGGFYRNFFAALKAGAGEAGGGLERLFITGVSPITMDDVTSGFNIGENVTLSPKFNDMLGFTEPEVRACWSSTGTAARSTRTWTRPST